MRALHVCAGVSGQHYRDAIAIVCKCNENSSIFLQHTSTNDRDLLEILQINLSEAVQEIPVRVSKNGASSLDPETNRHLQLKSHKGHSLEQYITELNEVSVPYRLMQGCFFWICINNNSYSTCQKTHQLNILILQGDNAVLDEEHSQSARSDKEAQESALLRALSKAGVANASTLCLPAVAAEHAGAAQGSQLSEGEQGRRNGTGDAVVPQGILIGTAEDDRSCRPVEFSLRTGKQSSLQPVLCGFQSSDRQRLYLLQPHAPHSLADLLRFNPTSLAHDIAVRLLLFQVQCQTHLTAKYPNAQVHVESVHALLCRSAQAHCYLGSVHIRSGVLPLQVISSLHELHSADLWHGQLSPDTVLLQSQPQPWLAGACLLPSESDQEQSLAELTARWHRWEVL